MSEQSLMWVAFGLLMVFMLAIDLGMNRKAQEVSFRQALTWSVIWVSLAMVFNVGIYVFLGQTKALEFFTGYVIEKSLSVDNLFVFIMIFAYFRIRGEHQARILKWGIIGALVLRALFIFTGIELLTTFHWMFYLFGALLLFTAWKMAFGSAKMIATAMGAHIPIQISLAVIVASLALAIIASLTIGKKHAQQVVLPVENG